MMTEPQETLQVALQVVPEPPQPHQQGREAATDEVRRFQHRLVSPMWRTLDGADSYWQQPGYFRRSVPTRLHRPTVTSTASRTQRSPPQAPTRSFTEFISDVIVPIPVQIPHDEYNYQRSVTSQSFHSTSKLTYVQLPNLPQPESDIAAAAASVGLRPRTSPFHKTVTLCGERYTVTPIHGPTPKPLKSARNRPRTVQQERFDDNVVALGRCRLLKRSAEILPHRVDRMYFMSGSSVGASGKYGSATEGDQSERYRQITEAVRRGEVHLEPIKKIISSPAAVKFQTQPFDVTYRHEQLTRHRAATAAAEAPGPGLAAFGSPRGHAANANVFKTATNETSEGGGTADEGGATAFFLTQGSSAVPPAPAAEGEQQSDGADAKAAGESAEAAGEDQPEQAETAEAEPAGSSEPDDCPGADEAPEVTAAAESVEADEAEAEATENAEAADSTEALEAAEPTEAGETAAAPEAYEADEYTEEAPEIAAPAADLTDTADASEAADIAEALTDAAGAPEGSESGVPDEVEPPPTAMAYADAGLEPIAGLPDSLDAATAEATSQPPPSPVATKPEVRQEPAKSPGTAAAESKPGKAAWKAGQPASSSRASSQASSPAKKAPPPPLPPAVQHRTSRQEAEKIQSLVTSPMQVRFNQGERTRSMSTRSKTRINEIMTRKSGGGQAVESGDSEDSDSEEDEDDEEDDNDDEISEAELMEMLETGQIKLEYDKSVFSGVKYREKHFSQMPDKRVEFREVTKHLVVKQDISGRDTNEILHIEPNMTPEQAEAFVALFDELDVNKDGRIAMEEVQKRLDVFKSKKKTDVKKFIRVFDLNGDRTVDVREFLAVAALNDSLCKQKTTDPKADWNLNLELCSYYITVYKEMFEMADQSKNGKLGLEELMVIVAVSLDTASGADLELMEDILNSIDRDRSGEIDFVEYLTYIPVFLKLHQFLLKKPMLVEDLEKARRLIKKSIKTKKK